MVEEIEYWKGKKGTKKDGMVGTKTKGLATPPDSEEATKEEYDACINSIPQIKKIDYKAMFALSTTNEEKIDIIAKKIGLI